MPTLLRVQGYYITIYMHDHRPAHVHAIGPDGRCVINLNCPAGPLELREALGITAVQIRRLATVIEAKLQTLCVKWREIHGHY